jgi:hypothetical protein
MNIIENIIDVVVFGTLVASIFGIKKPIFSAIAGIFILPLLYYFFGPGNIVTIIILIFVGFGLGYLGGFVLSIFFSGFKGKGHNTGPYYMGGFGGGRGGAPPGGIILSDEERKRLKKSK